MAEKQTVEVVEQRRPVGRPPKHGAYSKFALGKLTETKIQEIQEIMTGENLPIGRSDMMFVSVLGRLLAQMEQLERYYHEHGLFVDVGRGLAQPTLGHYLNLVKQASNMMEKLGMTTTSRFKLGRDVAAVGDIATQIQQAREQ